MEAGLGLSRRLGSAPLRKLAFFVGQRSPDRFGQTARADAEHPGSRRIAHRRLVAEAFDEFASDPGV